MVPGKSVVVYGCGGTGLSSVHVKDPTGVLIQCHRSNNSKTKKVGGRKAPSFSLTLLLEIRMAYGVREVSVG